MEWRKSSEGAIRSFRSICREKWELAKKNVMERELPCAQQTWTLLALGVGFQYVHTVATRISHYLHVPREPLYDLGFEFLFSTTPLLRLFAEFCSKVLGIWALWIIIRPIFRRTSHPYSITSTDILVQTLSVLLCVQVLRILTFTSTTLPGPSSVCRPSSPYYNPPTDAAISELLFPLDLFPPSTWLATKPSCGDSVFAWHTSLLLICALIVTQFGKAECDGEMHNELSLDSEEDAAFYGECSVAAGDNKEMKDEVTHALQVLRSGGNSVFEAGAASAVDEVDLCHMGVFGLAEIFKGCFKLLPWILIFVTSLVSISTQIHYSLDIVVAWFTVPLTWIAFDRKLGITARTERLNGEEGWESEQDEDDELNHVSSKRAGLGGTSSVLIIPERADINDDM